MDTDIAQVVQLVGRVLFAILFIASGFGHFAQRKEMVAYAEGSGAPLPGLLVPLTGVQILAGGLAVMLGAWADLGSLLLVVFLLPTAYYMHAFWKVEDPMMKGVQMAMFMKNVSLAGAALFMFVVFNLLGQQMDYMLTDPLLTDLFNG